MLSLLVDIRSCDPNTQISLEATIFVSINATFNVTDTNYYYVVPSSGVIVTTNFLLLAIIVMATSYLSLAF